MSALTLNDLAGLLTEDYDLVQQLESATHMHVTTTDPEQNQQWLKRRERARMLVLARIAELRRRVPITEPRE